MKTGVQQGVGAGGASGGAGGRQLSEEEMIAEAIRLSMLDQQQSRPPRDDDEVD